MPFGSVTVTLAGVPAGRSEMVIPRMVGVVTVIGEDPNLPGSCVEVAVAVALPELAGVKMPVEVIVPPVAVHVTAEL